MGNINREDMLELTRRMTPARTHFTRIAGAYMDEEGYVDGTFNTNFRKLTAAEKNYTLAIAKEVVFSETNVALSQYPIPGMKPGSFWRAPSHPGSSPWLRNWRNIRCLSA